MIIDSECKVSNNGTPASAQTPDPFDPASLRISQDFAQAAAVKKLLTTVPVQKPNRATFVRVHPDEDYQLATGVLEVDREVYLVAPALWGELSQELSPRILYTAITRQAVLFLWPVRMPNADGRLDNWSASANEAAQVAMKQWVRVASNQSLGAYEIHVAASELPEPDWPTVTFTELLRIAFKGRFIDSIDHAVLRALRGEK